MKPIGDIAKNQKTVQGFIGAGKSAAKASMRANPGKQKSVIITLCRGMVFEIHNHTTDTLVDLNTDMNTGNAEVFFPRCRFNICIINLPRRNNSVRRVCQIFSFKYKMPI